MRLWPLWRDDPFARGVDELVRDLRRRALDTDRLGGLVITDDLNPIDLARAETALAWRRRTLEALRGPPRPDVAAPSANGSG
jgi:hypothetical protein